MGSIFKHTDYRKFLREWLSHQPKRGRGLLRRWSEALGVNPSILSQILAGQRELSLDHAYQILLELGLGEIEGEYFLTLVTSERAATHRLKEYLKTKLHRQRQESLQLSKRIRHEALSFTIAGSTRRCGWPLP